MDITKNGCITIQMELTGEKLDDAKFLTDPKFLLTHKPEVTDVRLDGSLFSLNIEFIPYDANIGDVINVNNINKNFDVIVNSVSKYIKNNYKELICDRLIKVYIDSLFTDDMKYNFTKEIRERLSSSDN